MAGPDLATTFAALKSVLQPFEAELVKVHDEAGNYYLDTPHIQRTARRCSSGPSGRRGSTSASTSCRSTCGRNFSTAAPTG